MELVFFFGLIATLVLGALLFYYVIRSVFERRFRQWQDNETVKWSEAAKKATNDAVARSRAVLGGKFVEQLVPYLPEFKYDPTEARFIGSPIDLIVFPGLASGDPREIVIVEVKTGKRALTPQERKIRELIEAGMVRWELVQKSETV